MPAYDSSPSIHVWLGASLSLSRQTINRVACGPGGTSPLPKKNTCGGWDAVHASVYTPPRFVKNRNTHS